MNHSSVVLAYNSPLAAAIDNVCPETWPAD